jgi:hypothetical protein
MGPFRKVGLAAALGACVVAGSALGGGLLSAGAATNSTPSGNGKTFHSNESASHESGESAAREKAEDNGTAGPGRGPGGGGFPNEDPAHEKAESAAREKAEHDGTAGPGAPEAPSQSGTSSGASS